MIFIIYTVEGVKSFYEQSIQGNNVLRIASVRENFITRRLRNVGLWFEDSDCTFIVLIENSSNFFTWHYNNIWFYCHFMGRSWLPIVYKYLPFFVVFWWLDFRPYFSDWSDCEACFSRILDFVSNVNMKWMESVNLFVNKTIKGMNEVTGAKL